MISKKIDEAVFDILLEQAFSDVIEEDFQKLKGESETCTISAETEHKIRQLIARAGKTEAKKRAQTILRAASIVLVVLLNLSLIGILMVPSVNAEVRNVFAELFDKYVSFENEEQDSYIVTTSEYEIGYIPDGFEQILNDDRQIRFREQNDGNGYIMINISVEDFCRLSADSEYSSSHNIDINGFTAELCSFHDEYYITWYDGYHFILINTNIGEKELITIAKNIKKFQ